MGLNSTASGILQKETWQGRTVYNQSQKDSLQKWFEHSPYPDTATREQLAKEIGVPEYNSQIWFKNHRVKQRQLGSGSLEKDQTQGQDQHKPWTQEYLPKEARQDQTSITRSQSNILVQASDRNRIPDIATRKILAKQTGIPGSKIQMWFQNQRSLSPGQNRSEPVNSLPDGPSGTPDLTAQRHQIDLSTLSGWSHPFPSSNSFSWNQTFLPAFLPSHVSFVPCVSRGPSVVMVQPTQAVQEELTLYSDTYKLPANTTDFGRVLSDIHIHFWPQNQEKCQNHKQQTGTGALQLKDYCQPHPEHKKHQLQDLGHVDLSYIMQWWDECCQALTAEWDPGERIH
ncbi:double homeobox protein B [Hipposideros larvatus]